VIINLLKSNKDAIKEVRIDVESKLLILEKNNNQILQADLSKILASTQIQTVDTYADLPSAAENTSKTFIVATTTGIIGVNRKQAGLYFSDGLTWRRLAVNYNAEQTYYNNANSGLISTNVKAAIDEIDTKKLNKNEVATDSTKLDGKPSTHYAKSSQVLTNVPENAKFTDTIYVHPPGTNPHGTTKSDIGLENVDNTSDEDKPLSKATQKELKALKLKRFLEMKH
jgi:hypothetical protein